MLAHGSGEVEKGEILHPVVIVHQFGLVGLVAVEVQELGTLFFNGLLVVVECVCVEQVALLTLARRVAYHARGTSHEEIGFVSAALQVAQHHNATQVTDVKRVGCRVSAEIG